MKWNAFSVNLIKAIKSNHPGLQQSAMQQIIRYSDSLNVAPAVYNIGQIFRFDDNPRIRRLAMIALSKINTEQSLGALCRYVKFEDNESIRRQCCRIISDFYASKSLAAIKDLASINTR